MQPRAVSQPRVNGRLIVGKSARLKPAFLAQSPCMSCCNYGLPPRGYFVTIPHAMRAPELPDGSVL